MPTSRTAYEEALARIGAGEDPTGASIPSYITAADTLNVANGNRTFLEAAVDVVDSIPKFIATSVISGANQLYNIPTDIGNLITEGEAAKRRDTGEIIADLDSDLGKFYEEHKEGSDLVGFMVSSLVPGLGGIKALNAGQKALRTAAEAGKFGTGMGKSMGLLVTPQKQAFIDTALKQVATNSAPASIIQRNATKAVASGFGQNVLEVAAFETAVALTMFDSPILENQDFGDFVANVAFGAGVFGFIGGAVDATRIHFSLKKAKDAAAVEARPWEFIDKAAAASKGYEKIVLDFEQIANIPAVPTSLEPSRQAFLKAAAETKVRTLETSIRKELGELTRKDQDAATVLSHTFKKASIQDQQSAFIGLVEASKMGAPAKIADRVEKIQNKMAKGKASTKEIDEFMESSIAVSYAKTWGENAGKVSPEAPILTSLADTLKTGQKIKVGKQGVTAGSKKFKFDTAFNIGKISTKKIAKPWNILKADPFEAQARYIWAGKLDTFAPSAKNPLTVHVDDIPLMEKVLQEVSPEDLRHVTFKGLKEGEFVPNSSNLHDFIGDRKVMLANKLLGPEAAAARTQDEIAAIVNVKSSLLSGEVIKDPVNAYASKDILALQDHTVSYTSKLVAQGIRKESEGLVDLWEIPQNLKLTYDTTSFQGINNFVVENMAFIKGQQKVYQEGTSNMAARTLGDDYDKFEDINSGKVFEGAVPSGAGAGFASAASSNYGTLAASVENIGRTTTSVIEKFKNRTRDALEPLLYKLGNDQEAAIEWSVLNQRVRAIEGEYALNEAGDALEPLLTVRWRRQAAAAAAAGKAAPKQPTLANPAMEKRIEINKGATRNLVKAHIELNSARTAELAGIRTSQGLQFNRAPDAFYPIPVNPKDFPHFAMVIDESITSGNHTKTLFANSAEELESMADKLKQNPHYKVYFKKEAEEYYDSIGQHDYEKTINNSYLDVDAHRKGVSAPFIPATDPQKITSDMLNWHMARETGLVREAVTAKYEVQFRELESLGREHALASTSTFSSIKSKLGIPEARNNPFKDYIDTALGVKPTESYPWWTWTNTMADTAVSKVLTRAASIMSTAKTDQEIAKVNELLTKAGYKGAAYDESMDLFANTQVNRQLLTKTVQKANSILATVVLRLDVLNAVNNAVSANVLLGAETKAVIRAIGRGDKEAAGALSQLMDIRVPGTDKLIKSPTKLIANAVKKYGRDEELMKFYKDNGFTTTISEQYKSSLEALTFNGVEGVGTWSKRVDGVQKKLASAADKGEVITGNRLAEEFNRFVAADVMKQMTDVAVARNLMTGKEQLAYINTFVNRTQGNYLASQRPMMFHGPIGQAIGLFQTYQFNLMQQLLRHVGEGHAKDSMVLLALQGTIHGMNGLPGFNAINTHLVGNASGNTAHKDAYDAVYGIAGKEAGDWLMYGAASNALGLLDPDLKVNLYTRGDINPRQVTIVPTDPASVPIVQASAKFFANLFETAKKLGAGGDAVGTILQGLEHNGLSRPLAGIAQTLQGLDNPEQASYSTSKRGNVIAANDLNSLMNIVRIVGGKPMDEAIAIDATYRFKAYAAADTKSRSVLGEAIKSTMLAGKEPTVEQIENFAEGYAATGGRQEQFNSWFTGLYKQANLSQANEILQSLNSPFTQSMQKLMGGKELRDFTGD